MQIFYDDEGEKQVVSGEYLKKFILRNDLVPVPVTLEVDVRVEDEAKKFFEEGCKIYTANSDEFIILKSEPVISGKVQGNNIAQYVSITAVLSNMANICFARETALKKVNTSLADIYKTLGCRVAKVESDITVPVFNCMKGEPPSFQIACILQESGGVIRWKDGKLAFFRLQALFQQEVLTDVPIASASTVKSGFLERHEIPSFYSVDDAGNFIYGDIKKARSARFVANKDLATLQNMSKCLVLKQVSRIDYNENIVAGDLIQVSKDEQLVVMTAVHVFSAGVDGDMPRQYTKLWLGEICK